jgi:hypothetical protein
MRWGTEGRGVVRVVWGREGEEKLRVGERGWGSEMQDGTGWMSDEVWSK